MTPCSLGTPRVELDTPRVELDTPRVRWTQPRVQLGTAPCSAGHNPMLSFLLVFALGDAVEESGMPRFFLFFVFMLDLAAFLLLLFI